MSAESETKLLKERLEQSYQRLQNWWKFLLSQLPNQNLLQEIAKQNTDYDPADLRAPSNIYVSTLLSPELCQALFRKTINEFFSCIIMVTLDRYSDVYSFEFTPARLFYEPPPWDRSDMPFYKISALTAANQLDCLSWLEIRHGAIKRSERLVQSTIRLSQENQIVSALVQTAKDETFFPRPTPRYTRSRPYQQFLFSHNGHRPEYLFNYLVRDHLWPSREKLFARVLASRLSFLPYPGFSLPTAIEKACLFEPIVSQSPPRE